MRTLCTNIKMMMMISMHCIDNEIKNCLCSKTSYLNLSVDHNQLEWCLKSRCVLGADSQVSLTGEKVWEVRIPSLHFCSRTTLRCSFQCSLAVCSICHPVYHKSPYTNHVHSFHIPTNCLIRSKLIPLTCCNRMR